MNIFANSNKKIRKEATEAGESSLNTPGKNRSRGEEYKFYYDEFDQRVIRVLIEDVYLNQKRVPAVPKLLIAVRQ